STTCDGQNNDDDRSTSGRKPIIVFKSSRFSIFKVV
nr:hypothetical protein [Tanacetum cinerariifolium]